MRTRAWAVGALALAAWLGACGGQSGDSGRGSTAKSGRSTKKTVASAGSGAAAGSMASATDFGNNTAMPTAVTRHVDGGVDASTGPDQNNCGSLEVMPMVHMTETMTMTTTMTTTPGNLLIIFDKSLSMNDNWSNGTSKWQAATSAVNQAITALQSDIAMAGAIFFPWDDIPDGCNVDAINGGKQIDWMPGAQFAQALSSWFGSHMPGGLTPTDAAAQQADTALTNELPMLTGTTAVVFITDGDPTCGSMDASAAVQLVGQWLGKHMVKTYVVGLPGTSSAGQQVLMSLATAGGTMTYTSPNDPMALQNLLSQIVTSSVMTTTMTMTMTTTSFDSCMITLPMQPPNPDDVTLVVSAMGVKQQVARDLGSGGGWAINAEGTEIVLQGLFCDFAKMGKYDKVSVAFGCVDYPPLPPPRVE